MDDQQPEGGAMEACTKHRHEHGIGTCRRCGMPWCGDCLVYVYGTNKPPFCIGCAMFAGGVRSSGVMPAMSRKELRARHKATKAVAKAAKRATRHPEPEPSPEPSSESAGASHATADGSDWSTPWWESDREATLTN